MKASGSDLRRGPVTDRLAELGATIYEGHEAGHVAGATVVVMSSAVEPDESRSAGSAGAQDSRDSESGDAGRAYAAEVWHRDRGDARQDDNYLDGGVGAGGWRARSDGGGGWARGCAGLSNARLGTTQYLVAEADESDRIVL